MDASGSGLSQAAAQLLKDIESAQQDLDKKATGGGSAQGGGAQFNQVMADMESRGAQKVGDVEAADRSRVQIKTAVGSAEKTADTRVAKMLQGLIDGQDKMKHIMQVALSGHQLSPAQLITMQAGVYRFTQELELTTKVVEKATSGVKQTMNTQV